MERMNVGGAVAAVRAAARAGVARLVHTSSAATIGEAPGVVGTERTPHRGWYLSTYERTKTEGERAALATSREVGQDLVLVNPSSVQGPGRAGGTGRILLAFLDGRLRVFVPTYVSLVDIDDCVAGHLLAAERGVAGERYLVTGMTLEITQALALAAEVAGVQRKPRLLPRRVATVAAAAVERGLLLARAPAAGVPRDGPHAAPRPPLRRLARRARARAALHRSARDPAKDRRVGAGRGPHSLERLKTSSPPRRPSCVRTWRAGSTRSRWEQRRRWQRPPEAPRDPRAHRAARDPLPRSARPARRARALASAGGAGPSARPSVGAGGAGRGPRGPGTSSGSRGFTAARSHRCRIGFPNPSE